MNVITKKLLEMDLRMEIKDMPEEQVKEKLNSILKVHNIEFDYIDDECYSGEFRIIKGDEYNGEMLFEIFMKSTYNEDEIFMYTFDEIFFQNS